MSKICISRVWRVLLMAKRNVLPTGLQSDVRFSCPRIGIAWDTENYSPAIIDVSTSSDIDRTVRFPEIFY